MNIDRDKFLTEVMNECWHGVEIVDYRNNAGSSQALCKCGQGSRRKSQFNDDDFQFTQNDFSTWKCFEKLFNLLTHHDRKFEFFTKYGAIVHGDDEPKFYIEDSLIDPDKFADIAYAFLK